MAPPRVGVEISGIICSCSEGTRSMAPEKSPRLRARGQTWPKNERALDVEIPPAGIQQFEKGPDGNGLQVSNQGLGKPNPGLAEGKLRA